jgi:hypothetical protein
LAKRNVSPRADFWQEIRNRYPLKPAKSFSAFVRSSVFDLILIQCFLEFFDIFFGGCSVARFGQGDCATLGNLA